MNHHQLAEQLLTSQYSGYLFQVVQTEVVLSYKSVIVLLVSLNTVSVVCFCFTQYVFKTQNVIHVYSRIQRHFEMTSNSRTGPGFLYLELNARRSKVSVDVMYFISHVFHIFIIFLIFILVILLSVSFFVPFFYTFLELLLTSRVG